MNNIIVKDNTKDNWFIDIDPIKLNFIQIFFLGLLGIKVYKRDKATEMLKKMNGVSNE